MSYEMPEGVRKNFVDQITAGISPGEYGEIIGKIAAVMGDGPDTQRDESLVASGAALGAEHAQVLAMQITNIHARLFSRTIGALEEQIILAGDDAHLAGILEETIKPIRAAIADQINRQVHGIADAVSRLYGIPSSLLRARSATEEELAALDATASLLQPTEFHGFMVLRPDVGASTAAPDMARAAMVAADLPVIYIRESIEKYGSLAATANAFARNVVAHAWETMEKIEASYYQTTHTEPGFAEAQYEQLMGRVSGGQKPGV